MQHEATVRCAPFISVLGMGWRRRQDDLAAAAAWLWLPLVAAEDRWLAAEAGLLAAQALERAGQKDEAAATFAEVASRFRDTPFGPQAEEAKNRLAK